MPRPDEVPSQLPPDCSTEAPSRLCPGGGFEPRGMKGPLLAAVEVSYREAEGSTGQHGAAQGSCQAEEAGESSGAEKGGSPPRCVEEIEPLQRYQHSHYRLINEKNEAH